MRNKLRIEGERIYLRPARLSDATKEYANWLNDEEVNQFLEARFVHHAPGNLRKYIHNFSHDPNTLFLVIMLRKDNRCIGTIKLGSIDWHHKRADIGIMIGDKSYWGKGYATEAIKLLMGYAFNSLKLHRVTAGAYEKNIGSIKAFLKLGFLKEGRLKDHSLYKGKHIDNIIVAKLNK